MSRRKSSAEEVTINLTPMIDVVFLLVIFFMVGSKFSEAESRIQVQVPSVGDMRSLSRTPDERVVEVTAGGEVRLDGNVVSMDQLSATLRSQVQSYPALKDAVRGDGANSFQRIAEVLHVIRSSGVEKMGIAARSTTGAMRR